MLRLALRGQRFRASESSEAGWSDYRFRSRGTTLSPVPQVIVELRAVRGWTPLRQRLLSTAPSAAPSATLPSRAEIYHRLSHQRNAAAATTAHLQLAGLAIALPCISTRDSVARASSTAPFGAVTRHRISVCFCCPFRDRKPFPFADTQFIEASAVFSPDGRWIAYTSNEGGQTDVYVQSFPGPGAKTRVSRHGGTHPVWRAGGRELFYLAADGMMMAVPVGARRSFDAGRAAGSVFEQRLETHGESDLRCDQRRPAIPRQRDAAAVQRRGAAVCGLELADGVPEMIVDLPGRKVSDVYMYRFSRVAPSSRAAWGGAAHTSEVAYVFDNTIGDASQFEDIDRTVSGAMADAWVRFAKTGNPNGGGLPQWPAYRAPDYRLLDFGDAASVRSNARSPQIDLFQRAFETMRGKPSMPKAPASRSQ